MRLDALRDYSIYLRYFSTAASRGYTYFAAAEGCQRAIFISDAFSRNMTMESQQLSTFYFALRFTASVSPSRRADALIDVGYAKLYSFRSLISFITAQPRLAFSRHYLPTTSMAAYARIDISSKLTSGKMKGRDNNVLADSE